jgi:hypothetical protein
MKDLTIKVIGLNNENGGDSERILLPEEARRALEKISDDHL